MADIINLQATVRPVIQKNPEEESKAMRIAKLALILADKDTPLDEKHICIKIGVHQGFITKEEAEEFKASITELTHFMDDPSEEL